VDAYLPLREDLILTSHASYVLELLDRFTYEDETENSSVFRLLTDTLSRLASKADVWLVIRYYEIRLLDHLGFRPQLFECAMWTAIKARSIFSFRGRCDLSALRAWTAECQADHGGYAQVPAY
jgi:DNA repair protein RecO